MKMKTKEQIENYLECLKKKDEESIVTGDFIKILKWILETRR